MFFSGHNCCRYWASFSCLTCSLGAVLDKVVSLVGITLIVVSETLSSVCLFGCFVILILENQFLIHSLLPLLQGTVNSNWSAIRGTLADLFMFLYSPEYTLPMR